MTKSPRFYRPNPAEVTPGAPLFLPAADHRYLGAQVRCVHCGLHLPAPRPKAGSDANAGWAGLHGHGRMHERRGVAARRVEDGMLVWRVARPMIDK